MMILRAEIDQFGGLEEYKLELADGIQVLYGHNGTGKSTLALFIRVMLYGAGSERKKDEITLRQRILPLGKETASGRLVVKAGGRPLEISRVFAKTRRGDRTVLTWLDDGSAPVTSLEPGEFLLDINEATFTRTFFVGELGQAVPPGDAGQLENRLMSLSITGSENMDYTRAMKRLSQESRRISSPRGVGSLDALRKEQTELLAARAEARRLQEDADLLGKRLAEDQVKKDQLKQQLEELKLRAQSMEKLRELEQYEEAVGLIARKADLEKRIREKSNPFSKEQGGALKSRLEQLLAEESRLAQEVSYHNAAAEDVSAWEDSFSPANDRLFEEANERVIRRLSRRKESLEEKMNSLHNRGETELDELGKLREGYAKKQRRIRRLSSLVLWLLPLGLLLPGLVWAGLKADPWLTGGLLSSLILWGLIFFLVRPRLLGRLREESKDLRRQAEGLFGQGAEAILTATPSPSGDIRTAWQDEYDALSQEARALGLNMEDLDDYLREQARYQESRRLWQEARDKLGSAMTELKERILALEQCRASLLAQLEPAGLEADAGGLSQLQRMLNQTEIREREEKELEQTLRRLEVLSAQSNLNPLFLEPEKFKGEAFQAELDLKHSLEAQAEGLREELNALEGAGMRREAQQKALLDTLRRIRDPEAKLNQTAAEIAQQEKRLAVLALAMEHLEASYLEVQRDYLPRISRKLSLLFAQLTQGAYQEVMLTGDYRLKVKLKGEFTSMEYLSRGTLELLWLGLRLVLCDIITRGENAPLIFDDSFIHLDQDRLNSILNVLNERIDGQIIILTCHHRESSLLKDLG